MTRIIAAILAKSEEEFRAKVEKIRPLGLPLHIDVMDGQFVPQKTWADVELVREILGDIPFEAHLMVADPEHAVPVWFAVGAEQVIFHAEATTREAMICRALCDRRADVSIALNPETPISRLTEQLPEMQRAMVMGVTPGKSGQEFQDIALEKIRMLKNLKPSLSVSIDGGVKPENARELAEAGADTLVIGSALTDQDDPRVALEMFMQALGK